MLTKLGAILNYIGVLFLLLLTAVGGVLLYPLIYTYRDIAKKPPLWWWFDDEDGLYGADYWREAKNITKKNFWVSYRWCGLRNPMWNAKTKLVPIQGMEFIISKYGKLTRNKENVSLKNSAVFHYVDDYGVWNNNSGKWLSLKYSYIGWSFLWFKKHNKTYFRFSFAKQIWGKLGLEIQIGTFHRYAFKVKLKWHNKIFEDIEITNLSTNVIMNYKNNILPKRPFTIIQKISKFIINY